MDNIDFEEEIKCEEYFQKKIEKLYCEINKTEKRICEIEEEKENFSIDLRGLKLAINILKTYEENEIKQEDWVMAYAKSPNGEMQLGGELAIKNSLEIQKKILKVAEDDGIDCEPMYTLYPYGEYVTKE